MKVKKLHPIAGWSQRCAACSAFYFGLMGGRLLLLVFFLGMLGLVSGVRVAYAQHEVTISSYSISTTPSSGYPDTGGMELTDGTVPTGAWGDGTTFDNSPYVGWSNINAKFTLNFSGTQQVAAVRLTLADSDGGAGVALPSSMVVDPDNNSTKQTISIPNPSGSGLSTILLVLNTPYSGSSMTIELVQSGEFIMLAEVEVFSSVPMDGDFTISTANALSYAVPFAENTGAAAGRILKNGNGALTLSGNNTFTGGVIVNTTGTSANSSKIVAGSDAAFGTGTIELKGTTNGTGSTLDMNGRTLGNNIDIEFTNTGISGRSLENSSTSTPAVLNGDLTIGGANYVGGAGDITFNGIVSGGQNNDYSFFKQDAGTWTFANTANTFDGFFYLIGGEVEVNTLANDGVASSLGQISAGTNFFKFGFAGSGGGILRYIGSTASTSNRQFRFLGSGTGASNRIEANGASTSATLNLTGTAYAEAIGTYNFSLSGTNTGDNTYSGVISNGSGTVAILKEGTGTWRLTGANTYSGGTTINGGRLIGNATSIKGVNVPNNSELELDQATAGTLGSNILGTGAVFKTGAGALTLSGSNSYTGGTTISAGRLIGTSVNSITGDILNNSELEFAQSSTVTFAGAISGTGTLYKTGTGTLTLSGNSSYTGGTTFNAGTLTLGNDNALGTGDLTITGTGLTLSTNAARTIPNAIVLNNDATIATGTHAFTINGGITGTGKLTKTGTGTLTLGGTNTFSGGFTIQGGSGANSIIKATSSDAFGTGTVEILGSSSNSGSTLDLNGQTLTNDITIGNKNSGVNNEGAIKNTDTANPATLNGTVVIGGEIYAGGDGDIIFNSLVTGGLSNIYSIYKMGSGTWRFTNNANTFDGFFYLIGGEVEVTSLANSGEASSLGQVTASQNLLKFGFNGTGGGTLRFVGSAANSSDRTFEMMGNAAITNRIEADGADANASLTLTGNLSPVRSGNYTLALGGANTGNNTFSGVLADGSGNLALEKDDAGTWVLSGTNTYTGATTINAGKIIINGDHSAATGAITVGNGATLGGVGLMGGTITFQDGSFFNPGTSPGILTTQTGLTLQTGNTFNWELTANESTPANRGTTYDGVDVSGGGLTIQTGVTANLDFTVGVDFTDTFWQTPQQWLVFDNGNPPALNSADIFDAITFTNDANGQALTSVSGLSGAYFYWSQSGNDVYLHYSPTGPPSAVTSIATANPSIIATGGTSTITIQLKDANGNNITTGGESVSYVLNTPNLGTPGSFTDNGDGTYTTVFTANSGSNTGDEVITFTLNGTNFTNTLTITIIDEVFSGAQVLDGTSGNTQITDFFTTDGNLSLSQGFFVDYLIVGGGGGGGGSSWTNGGGSTIAGGGGAGGEVLTSLGTSKIQIPSSLQITIGNGGSGGTAGVVGLEGGITSLSGASFTTIQALGGGRAGGRTAPGYSAYGPTNFAGDVNQGGDGARGVTANSGRSGGSGISNDITGIPTFYGGGGSAGGRDGDPSGLAGGAGGGGAGTNYVGGGSGGIGGLGGANTGGGGGGASANTTTYFNGGAGGSGLAVLRFEGGLDGIDVSGLASSDYTQDMGGSLAGNALIQFKSSHTLSLDLDARLRSIITNSISGSGTFAYDGPGTLVLGANNSYTGNTTITAGTLQIGNGGTSGTLGAGAISNSGVLRFNRSNTITLANGNLLSGTGTVEQSGEGTLDLGGNSHSAGEWVLQAGSISNGTLSSGDFTLENGTLSAVLSGTGNLTKNTPGTVTLSANNDYSGTTTIDAGILTINGSHTGTGVVAVNAGGTLKGSGSIAGNTTIANNGTMLAGNSIGTLNFGNDLTFESGGNWNWQITNGSDSGSPGSDWDQILVGGLLTITATSADPFHINVWSILGDGTNGLLNNFEPTLQAYTWTILTATGGITGFDADHFEVHTEPNNGAGGLITASTVEGFSVLLDGNSLKLQYDPPAAQTIDGTNDGSVTSSFTTENTSGQLTLDLGFFAEYLVVGGGGGGSGTQWENHYAGGGGSGGEVISNLGATPIRLWDESLTISIGAGGSAGTHNNPAGNGGNTVISGSNLGSIQALGGGRAGNPNYASQLGGGLQNQGGYGVRLLNPGAGRSGGAGISNAITGGDVLYGGGGSAGGRNGDPNAMPGGTGGGGGGTNYVGSGPNGNGGNGVANTGGGGGGASATTVTYFSGGSGGSGVAVLRYEGDALSNVGGTVTSFTGNGTIGENGVTYQVHTFTSSGNFDLSQVDFNARLKATLSGNIVGSGDLIYDSEGRLTLTGSAHTYTGQTIIENGELRVNSDLTNSSDVLVKATAILSGTGDLPPLDVYGKHRPGNSPGIQTIRGTAIYRSGSVIEWELNTNSGTSADDGVAYDGVAHTEDDATQETAPIRGVHFDGINVEGDLHFGQGSVFEIRFDDIEGDLDWKHPEWKEQNPSTRLFKVFELGSESDVYGLDDVDIRSANGWIDSKGQSFEAVHPGKTLDFEFLQIGNEIYLQMHINEKVSARPARPNEHQMGVMR